MAEITLPSKYARAFLSIVKKLGTVESSRQEFVEMRDRIFASRRLSAIFKHPEINREDKKKIFSGVFPGTSATTLNLMRLLIDRKREGIFRDFVAVFSDMADHELGIKKVTVQTAYPLAKTEEERLIKRLGKAMKAKLQVKTEVDSDLLGGIIIKERFAQVDVSARQFLKSMRQSLATAGLPDERPEEKTAGKKQVKRAAKPAKAGKEARKKNTRKR